MRVVIMGNVFPTDTRLHRKYDLKGSTYGRTAGSAALSDPNAVLKVCAPPLDTRSTSSKVRGASGVFVRGLCVFGVLLKL